MLIYIFFHLNDWREDVNEFQASWVGSLVHGFDVSICQLRPLTVIQMLEVLENEDSKTKLLIISLRSCDGLSPILADYKQPQENDSKWRHLPPRREIHPLPLLRLAVSFPQAPPRDLDRTSRKRRERASIQLVVISALWIPAGNEACRLNDVQLLSTSRCLAKLLIKGLLRRMDYFLYNREATAASKTKACEMLLGCRLRSSSE